MFGDRLRMLRKSKGLTQGELGKLLGLAISTVSGYESGSRLPDLEKLKEIANFFGVSIDYLLNNDSELSEMEKSFLLDLDTLSFDEIIKKYRLVIDEKPMTTEEIEGAIAYIKTIREMNKP